MKLTIWWKHFCQNGPTNEIFCWHWGPPPPQKFNQELSRLRKICSIFPCLRLASSKKPTFWAERALDQVPCGPDEGKKQPQTEELGHCASTFRAREAGQMSTGSIKGRQSSPVAGDFWKYVGPPLLCFITETSGFSCFQVSDLSRSLGGNEWRPCKPRLYFVEGFLENLANADSENTQMRKAESTGWTVGGFPNSHIPYHHPCPPQLSSYLVHCYCLCSCSFIYS